MKKLVKLHLNKIYLAFSKILVAGGSSGQSVEVVNLDNTDQTCDNLATLPMIMDSAVGGLLFQRDPVLCGGRSNLECLKLDIDEWTSFAFLKEERYLSSSIVIPSNNSLLIIGGQSLLSSTEAVTLTSEQSQVGPGLDFGVESHCTVQINSTTIAIIGGSNSDTALRSNSLESLSKAVTFLNTLDGSTQPGPELNKGRRSHACGLRDSGRQIVVAGGYLEKSVELLDISGQNSWTLGPELGQATHGSAMVADANGQDVILVGGTVLSNVGEFEASKSLYVLKKKFGDNEELEWVRLEQELKEARSNHVAFGVPDSILSCQ